MECAGLRAMLTSTTSATTPGTTRMELLRASILIPLPRPEEDAKWLVRLSLLAQIQALAFGCALALTTSGEQLDAVLHTVIEQGGPLDWQSGARLTLRGRQPDEVEWVRSKGMEVSIKEGNPLQKPVAEALGALDRAAYSIERSVSRALERLITANSVSPPSTTASTRPAGSLRPTLPSKAKTGPSEVASSPSLESSSPIVLNARHRSMKIILHVDGLDTDAYWERVARFGHSHVRYNMEAASTASAEREGDSPSKASSSKESPKWLQDSFSNVHKVFLDLVKGAANIGKLDREGRGFGKLVETWTSLARRVSGKQATWMRDVLY
jgi:hypothetical protein